MVADTERKTTQLFQNKAGAFKWVCDDAILFCRDAMDTTTRGTWLRTIGEDEVRISTEPFTHDRNGNSSVLRMKEEELVVFGTNGGLYKALAGSTGAAMVAALPQPPLTLRALEKWEN